MSFPCNMVNTIINCITSVSLSITINVVPFTYFKLKRGIIQGDTLSPYLFIICVEVLSGMLTRSQNTRYTYGLSIARKEQSISHLLFSEDSLVFCRENEKKRPRTSQNFGRVPKNLRPAG